MDFQDLTTDELRGVVNSLRLDPSFAWLTKELKQEYRDCAEYCKRRRLENWRNRSGTGVEGVNPHSEAHWQERMKLPRLVEMRVESRFGKEWRKDKSAWKWVWSEFPQFRLIENKGKNPYG